MSDKSKSQFSDIILYSSPEGNIHVEVIFSDETFWLTINKMAELFGTSKQNISYHLQNIYKEKELDTEATVKEFLTVQDEVDWRKRNMKNSGWCRTGNLKATLIGKLKR